MSDQVLVQTQAAHAISVVAWDMSVEGDRPGRVSVVLEGECDRLLPHLTRLVAEAVTALYEAEGDQ